jgi:hypothetical protein
MRNWHKKWERYVIIHTQIRNDEISSSILNENLNIYLKV